MSPPIIAPASTLKDASEVALVSGLPDLNVGLFTMEPLLFVLDGSCGILNCSDSVLRAFSLSREQIIGAAFPALLLSLRPEWSSSLPERSAMLLKGGYYIPWGNSPSGSIGWNVCALPIDPDSNYATSLTFVPGPAPEMVTRVMEEGISGSVGMALHELFQRAQQVDARYRGFLRLLPGVSFVQDLDLRFNYRSSELRVLLGGGDYNSLESCDWKDWLSPEDREGFERSLERCVVSQHPVSVRFRLNLPKKKKTLYLMEIRFPVRSVDGKLCGFEGLWLDLTPQKIAEKRLQEAAWKESLNEVSGSLTHDFNNILTGIINLADLMRPDYANSRNDGSATNIDLIWESAKRAKGIVQRIVSLNRTQSGTVELLELCDVVKYEYDLIRIVLPQRIKFTVNLPDAEIPVRIDRVVLSRILLNFATNARDAIADKGEVKLSARLVHFKDYARDDLFSSLCPYVGRGVELIFSDTGKGIDPQNIDRIFCPYFSTKDCESGTGLGLSSLSRYAMDNGFDFGVRSVVGRGTEMLLLLPFDEQDPIDQSADAALPSAERRNYRPPHDGQLRVGVFAHDEKYADSLMTCLSQDYGVPTRVLARGNSVKTWMAVDGEESQDHCAVSVIRADTAAGLSVELREFLLLGNGRACRIALVKDPSLAQTKAMRGELFDELLEKTNDPELDARNILRCLRHSALFALKDYSTIEH